MLASLSARATGSSKNEEDKSIPVDIHVGMLGDWLKGRSMVKGKWQTDLVQLRERIEDASEKIPEDLDEVQCIIKQPGVLNYFQCCKVLNLLEKQLGDKAKNFLGMYKDDQLKEWNSIKNQYEKNNIGLAEASRIMERNTMYEIPALKNSIQKNEKEASDLVKKVISHEKTIEEAKRAFDSACEKLAIRGVNLRDEVISLGHKLPELLHGIATLLCDGQVRSSVELYRSFACFMHSVQFPDGGGESVERVPFLFQATKDDNLMEHLGQADDQVAPASAPAEVDWGVDVCETGDVDWGIEATESSNAVEWEVEVADSSEVDTNNKEGEEISWDIEVAEDAPADGGGIDWGFEIEDATAANEQQDTLELQVDGIGENSESSSPSEFDLMNKDVRRKLMNDLIEVDGFLIGKIQEQKSLSGRGETTSLMYYFNDAPKVLDQSMESLVQMSEAITKCIAALSSPELHELVMIKQGGKFLDRMVDVLEKKKSMASKLEAAINRMQTKRSQLLQANGSHSSKLKEYVEVTLELKKDTEAQLSRLLDNRIVRIVGDINSI